MKALNFIISYVIYPFDVMVSIAENNDTLRKKLLKYGAKIDDIDLTFHDCQQGRCIMFPGGQTLIRLYKYPKTPQGYGHLQHEIFHAVEFLMSKLNTPLTEDSDEAYAYAIDYLTTEIYKRLK